MKLLTLILCLQSSIFAIAQQRIQPYVSFKSFRCFTTSNIKATAGKFLHETRKINTGIDVKSKFPLSNKFGIISGLSFTYHKSQISALNTVPELNDYPYPFIWKEKYSHVTMPILVYYKLENKNSNQFTLYGGFSIGYYIHNYEKISLMGVTPININYLSDQFELSLSSTGELKKNKFLPTAEIGLEFPSLNIFPRFSFSLWVSSQLGKINLGNFQAQIKSIANNKKYNYQADIYERNFFAGIAVHYQLKKP